MKIRNNMGPRTLPWGTPALTGRGNERVLLRAARWLQELVKSVSHAVELALDAIRREFGEQCRMPDCIKCMIYVQRDSPDLMSDIEGLHPLLGEKNQHVQGGVTWSETKFVSMLGRIRVGG